MRPSSLTVPVVGEPPSGLGNLTLLALDARIGALVVASEQQDQPFAVRMAEDAQQDSLVSRFVARRLAERPQDLAGIVAQAELEEAVAELLAVGTAADTNPLGLEDLGHRDTDRAALLWGQLLPQPAQDRLIAVSVGIEIEREPGHRRQP